MIKSCAYKLYLQCISDIYHYTIHIYFWGGLLFSKSSKNTLKIFFTLTRETHWSTSIMSRLFSIDNWQPWFHKCLDVGCVEDVQDWAQNWSLCSTRLQKSTPRDRTTIMNRLCATDDEGLHPLERRSRYNRTKWTAIGVWMSAISSPAGSGAEPQTLAILVHFRIKKKHLVLYWILFLTLLNLTYDIV